MSNYSNVSLTQTEYTTYCPESTTLTVGSSTFVTSGWVTLPVNYTIPAVTSAPLTSRGARTTRSSSALSTATAHNITSSSSYKGLAGKGASVAGSAGVLALVAFLL